MNRALGAITLPMQLMFMELGVSVRNKAGVPVISILPMQDVRVHLAGVQFFFKIKFFRQ